MSKISNVVKNPNMSSNIINNSPRSIDSSYQSLVEASKDDSSWTPKIIMNIPTPSLIRQLMPSAFCNGDKTDIVLFNTKPSLHIGTVLKNALFYPEGCTFYFAGYDGIENADRLKKDIINAAAANGSTLTIDINDQYKHCGNK